MGAGRFPEQIAERADAGLRALLEDQTPDPIIEKLNATPVNRVIVPEEKNVRRKLSPGAEKGRKTIARKLAIMRQLKPLTNMLFALESTNPHLRRKIVDQKIAALKQHIRMLRSKLPSKIARKKRRRTIKSLTASSRVKSK